MLPASFCLYTVKTYPQFSLHINKQAQQMGWLSLKSPINAVTPLHIIEFVITMNWWYISLWHVRQHEAILFADRRAISCKLVIKLDKFIPLKKASLYFSLPTPLQLHNFTRKWAIRGKIINISKRYFRQREWLNVLLNDQSSQQALQPPVSVPIAASRSHSIYSAWWWRRTKKTSPKDKRSERVWQQ